VQDRLFDFGTGQWLIDKHDPALRLIFYTAPKWLVGVFGLYLLVSLARTFRQGGPRADRRRLLFMILCLAIVPIILSGSKNFTNVYCPWDVNRYGGTAPYVKLFESYPEGYEHAGGRPKCFPAGHSSGGFALMGLYYFRRRRTHRFAGLCLGLASGWAMGGYQMLKGAHYLSHTVASMLIAWLIIVALRGMVEPS
jgi:membrane-associated PAP2 superfamily phosphatase